MEELFIQIGIVMSAAAALSFFAYRFRQPLLVAYIATGILIGPSVLNIGTEPEFFQTMSDIGIAFLLFIVGLNLNWKHIKEVGAIALATGLGQVAFTGGAGYFIGILLGFSSIESLYIGIAFSFSSTIIIVKLLSDKEDLQRLYGRISVGFLIVQDLIAMLVLLFLGAMRQGGDISTVISYALGQWVIIILALVGITIWILPKLAAYAAKSQELLFMFGLAWCFGLASVLSLSGFGIEIGALLAGITLAGTVWSGEISAKIRSLRDFFLVIFFVLLGTQLSLGSIEALIIPAIIFSIFILVGNPLIVMLIMRSLGYHPRTGFLAGTTVAQISEFSFIMLAAGVGIGHIGDQIVSFATLVGIITITASSYLITFNEQIYEKISPFLRWLEPPRLSRKEGKSLPEIPVVIMFGYHSMGRVILPKIKAMNVAYLVVDFDPTINEELKQKHIPHTYGDAGNHEFLGEISTDRAKLIISTIPDEQVSLSILSFLKQKGFKGSVILTVKSADEAGHVYREGATFVIVPSILGGERFAEILQNEKLDARAWDKVAKFVADRPELKSRKKVKKKPVKKKVAKKK